MSYCRTGAGSDVYVIGGGKGLECWVADAIAGELGIRSHYFVPYSDHDESLSLKAMLGHLYSLRDAGVRVPGRALRRLLSEIYDADQDYLESLN